MVIPFSPSLLTEWQHGILSDDSSHAERTGSHQWTLLTSQVHNPITAGILLPLRRQYDLPQSYWETKQNRTILTTPVTNRFYIQLKERMHIERAHKHLTFRIRRLLTSCLNV